MPSISRIIVGHNEHSIDTSANLPECRERVEHTRAYVQTYLGFICTHTHTHIYTLLCVCVLVSIETTMRFRCDTVVILSKQSVIIDNL